MHTKNVGFTLQMMNTGGTGGEEEELYISIDTTETWQDKHEWFT